MTFNEFNRLFDDLFKAYAISKHNNEISGQENQQKYQHLLHLITEKSNEYYFHWPLCSLKTYELTFNKRFQKYQAKNYSFNLESFCNQEMNNINNSYIEDEFAIYKDHFLLKARDFHDYDDIILYPDLFENTLFENLKRSYFDKIKYLKGRSRIENESSILGTQHSNITPKEVPFESIIKNEPTQNEKLFHFIKEFDFYKLEKVAILNPQNQDKLSGFIAMNKLPYTIAMFNYLDFLEYLEKHKFKVKKEMYMEISKWFNSDTSGRTVRGLIGSLLRNSRENKDRYTAHLHKETVERDYQSLKQGVLLY